MMSQIRSEDILSRGKRDSSQIALIVDLDISILETVDHLGALLAHKVAPKSKWTK